MARPKVFVSRRIPDEGLNADPRRVRRRCVARATAAAARRAPRAREGLRRPRVAAHRPHRRRAARRRPEAEGGEQLRGRVQQRRRARLHRPRRCVGNTPGVLTDATADIAVTLLLAAARRLGESATDAKEGRWLTWEPLGWLGQDLAGRTLGIVGMGRIGFAAAKRLHHGWGMKVLYTEQVPTPEAEQEFGATRVDLDTLLARERLRLRPRRSEPDDEGDVRRGAVQEDEADGGVREHGPRAARRSGRAGARRCAAGPSSPPAST